MRHWEIALIAESAFRHGQAYAQGRILRSFGGKYVFKNPEVVGLPDYVVRMPIEQHCFLAKVYKHAFRQGFKKG